MAGSAQAVELTLLGGQAIDLVQSAIGMIRDQSVVMLSARCVMVTGRFWDTHVDSDKS